MNPVDILAQVHDELREFTAMKAGYKDADHMKKDTDLDPLRGRDDFKKLLAELEKPVGRKK